MSSGRDSTGDLIPQDVLEVFSQERQIRRGKRSRRRNKIGKAFSWLKGRRRKNLRTNKDVNISLLAPGLPVPITLPSTNTVEGETSCPVQHVQENVFIDGNRPKYVQDLHTEAQEGLRLLQQDENRNGVDFQDDQSVISTVTARTDTDMSFSELGMSECESATADTISTRSVVSYQSSRSGLTRQGSTFRPLKEDRKHKKSKVRKANVVAGIPRHVQKELGLDRAAWTSSHFTDAQLSNGGVSISTVIPTLDSISMASVTDGAIMQLQSIHSLQTVTDDKPQLPPQEGQENDLSVLRHFLPQSFDPQNPNALAATWMTTSGNSQSSPVMYVSPEATYMSKIIPNAILPPSVDVVELSRTRTRSSVRMVSKSSLVSASPAPSRASSRASSRFSSRAPSQMSSRASSRASTYRTTTLSESSGCSHSGSSETLVSNSSTISRSSTPHVASRSQTENIDGSLVVKYNPVNPVHINGNNKEEDWKISGSTGPFNRSLSVMKKSKKPPPPPCRSYSLHSRSYTRNNAEIKSVENGSQKVESPYSAYTSQNGNIHTNGKSRLNNLKHFLPSIKSLTANGMVASPSMMTLMALLDVPDPPQVIAPPSPPPETWAHNQRTFELLCGPGPVNFERWAQKRNLKIEVPVQTARGKITAPNGVKDNGVARTTHEAIITDMQYRTVPTKMDINVQPLYGNTLPLPGLTHVHLNPSSLPPPEHIPPFPPTNQVQPLKEDSSAQFQGPLDEIICPPPHPLFPPPPPPPPKVPPPHPPGGQDETDFYYAPMPSSLRVLFKGTQDAQPSTLEEAASSSAQKIPPAPPMVPPVIPPAPLMIPPAPPVIPFTPPVPPALPAMLPPPTSCTPPPPPVIPHAPPVIPFAQTVILPAPFTPPVLPPAPPAIPIPPTSCTPPPPPVIPYAQPVIPPPKAFSTPPPAPPLPVDLKKEVKSIVAENQENQSSPPTTHTSVTTEESPVPMVTPSLLQTVRLRSIRSNVIQAGETPGGLPKPNQKITQEAPQKPKRRSLIMITTDIPMQSYTDGTPPVVTVQENQGTAPPPNTQTKAEPKVLSGNAEQIPVESKSISITDQNTQTASTEPIKSVSAEPEPQIHSKTEPEPKTTLQEIQNATPDPPTTLTPSEPTDQPSDSDGKDVQNGSIIMEDKQDTKLPKPQTVIPTSPKNNPAQKVPSVNIPLSSMRLQEAIRLKTAAMSSTDHQAKRLSLLYSPPPVSSGPISPTSTANFIFSKNPKRVLIEKSPSSPESRSDLRRTLVYEFNSVSQTSKLAPDPQSTKAKVPPPVAKKPAANVTQNPPETNVDTEHVQAAGQ